MKKLRNTIACGVAALALLATGLTSCTGDFDNINTSKDKPTPEDVDLSLIHISEPTRP